MPTADFEAQVESTVANIRESGEIHDRNKGLVREYLRDQRLNGLADATLSRNLGRLKVVAEHVDQPFDEMDKDDVKDVIEWIQGRDYTEETVDTYKNVIRSFFKWMDPTDDGEPPSAVSWITMSPSNGSNGKLPKDLLTEDDVDRQIDAAKNPRDKALIALLYETGARIGELIDLTVGDIEDRKRGKKVVIDGKTGQRRLPLVKSVSYLNRWLNQHPKPEKDAPLWCKIQQGDPDEPLGYRYIREKILEKNMNRAGIDKPSNPHHYRHSRASHLATEMTESALCEFFGWVQGSDVPAKYVHLSGRDLDAAYDAMHGLVDPDEDDDGPDVIECWRCEELEEPDRRFCGKCGAPLDEEAQDMHAEVQRDIGEEKAHADGEDLTDEELEEMAQDDELLERLIEIRAEG